MKEIRQLLSFLRPFAKEVALSVLIGVATIGAGVGMLGTSAFLIASAALHPSIADLQVAIVGVRFFGISRSVFRYLERLVSHSVNLRVLTSLRVWLYEAAERVAPAGLQTERGGELLNRVMADLDTLENFYVRVVSPVLVAVVITAGMSLFLGGYFWPLGLILAAGMLLNGFILPGLSILLTRHSGARLQQARADLSANLLETFQGLADLQASGANERWLQKVEADSRKVGRLQLFYGVLTGFNDGMALLVLNLTLLAVLAAAIPQVSAGQMSGVSLAVVSLLTMAAFEATNTLPQAAQNLTASVASARRLFSLVRTQWVETEPLPDLREERLQAAERIEIRGLDFSYPGNPQVVLQHIDLTLQRGRITALVGPSGGGKTSLVNLLLRFWQPAAGTILLDGVDIRTFSEESTRRLFGVISQSSYLFAQTLRQNLRLAKPEATDKELMMVLQLAELEEWYQTLPEGLSTWLGEQGERMSGGERQRLAIARVLLQDTPFVLLDEPTANLDAETEKRLLATLKRVFADKGVLMITHRLAGLEMASDIEFIAGGQVSEKGDQNQLLAQKGAFARYWQLQKNQT